MKFRTACVHPMGLSLTEIELNAQSAGAICSIVCSLAFLNFNKKNDISIGGYVQYALTKL